MITIFPDYAVQTSSRAAHKATQLTDPMRQLSSMLDIARSDDADQSVYITLDQFAKIQPFTAEIEDKGGKIRYVVTQDSGMPLEAAWTQAVSGKMTVEIGVLDAADQAEYERAVAAKPIKEGADFAAIRQRANARPGAKPVVPIGADPTDPDNWED